MVNGSVLSWHVFPVISVDWCATYLHMPPRLISLSLAGKKLSIAIAPVLNRVTPFAVIESLGSFASSTAWPPRPDLPTAKRLRPSVRSSRRQQTQRIIPTWRTCIKMAIQVMVPAAGAQRLSVTSSDTGAPQLWPKLRKTARSTPSQINLYLQSTSASWRLEEACRYMHKGMD